VIELRPRPEDAERMLQRAERYERRVEELCGEWSARLGESIPSGSDMNRLIAEEWEGSRRLSRWQDYLLFVMVAEAVGQMERNAQELRARLAKLRPDEERSKQKCEPPRV